MFPPKIALDACADVADDRARAHHDAAHDAEGFGHAIAGQFKRRRRQWMCQTHNSKLNTTPARSGKSEKFRHFHGERKENAGRFRNPVQNQAATARNAHKIFGGNKKHGRLPPIIFADEPNASRAPMPGEQNDEQRVVLQRARKISVQQRINRACPAAARTIPSGQLVKQADRIKTVAGSKKKTTAPAQ
jgi:hypothetical protein